MSQLVDASTSVQLGKFCGTNIPDPVFTSSNRLQITFHTDSSITGQGFLLNWQSVSTTAVTPPLANATNAPGTADRNTE